MSTRRAVLGRLLDELAQVRPGERAAVALDGVDGVGKTHLAAELLALAEERGGRALRTVSIDGFHRPRRDRRAAGAGAEGFYRGSYRYDAFLDCVIEPLRAGEPITPAVWDVARDRAVHPVPITVPEGGLLLVDGIFLQRPEMSEVWDAVAWVEAPFTVTVPRGNARFPGRHEADPESPANARYVGGQRLYLAEVDPRARATWILDNTNLEAPVLTRRI